VPDVSASPNRRRPLQNPENGIVTTLQRFPVKSMQGEVLAAVDVTARGLLGDRAYALVDSCSGKVASAKNPRYWPGLLDFAAVFEEAPRVDGTVPSVRITTPDGGTVTSADPAAAQSLSAAIGRTVVLSASAPAEGTLEEYWPDIEGLANREVVTDERMPAGTFFDCATVHVLTTSTLAALSELYPAGDFTPARFRPNIIVATSEPGFVEQAWVGSTLRIGDEVELEITMPCGRCVMTTLAQGDLPADAGILRTPVKYASASVGVYASVRRGGHIRSGDRVSIVPS